ncbi:MULTISPECIES: hypothetical protein [unclassified Mesorhizobium]|uniref:hypothetical protein n=1 Tax=unclassified Mesorhizobium TaxID=325217 RepID=UPI0012DE8BE8|nr:MULTISPECIES: hypothetical protein [unclassified Mesorhizobium]WJI71112.1 hypothetical protein NLY36_10075 [Mesorhizobium sp. C399B]
MAVPFVEAGGTANGQGWFRCLRSQSFTRPAANFGNTLPIQRLWLMEGTHLSNRSSHAETLRTVSDLLHRARRVIRDGGHAAAMFEIDTLLQVAQTEVARRLERNDR